MPAYDEAAADAWARRLRLAVDPRRRRLGAGSRLGQGPGASLEFHDHRAYVPGDDLRHLDWGVLARTDQLVLRRYRVEVAPRLEIFADASASMGLVPAKAALAAALTALLIQLVRGSGARLAVWAGSDRWERLDAGGRDAWRPRLRALEPHGPAGFEAAPVPALSAGAERILVGDGLCPGGGPLVAARLGAGAGRIALVQVLTRAEVDPAAVGPVRLVDAERGVRDQVVDHAAVDAYRARFARHQQGWESAMNGRGAGVVTCLVEDGLDAAVRNLLRAGLVAGGTR